MYKAFVLIFIALFPFLLHAQQKSLIVLQRSDSAQTITKTGTTYIRNPTFQHAGATLRCDSAVFYKDRNFFEAFKNVHIVQGDTINIYADFLTYDGNTKQAHLTDNVKMITPTSTLTTSVLDYNTGFKTGKYYNGGKIVNPSATVTSKLGWYFTNTRNAYFRYEVLVTTPQSKVDSDTLRYNTFTNWAYFYGPTNITSEDDKMYTENGAYNTRNEKAYFGKKNLYTNGSRFLKGDSLYYDGKRGYGKAVKNIVYTDTTDRLELRGQLGEYYKADEKIVVTRNAYVGMDTKDSVTINNKKIPDTLWLAADTLQAKKTLVKNVKLLKKPTALNNNEIGKESREKAEEKAKAKKLLAEEQKKEQESKHIKNVEKPSKKQKPNRKKLPDTLAVKPPASTFIREKIPVKDTLRKDSLSGNKKINVKDTAGAKNAETIAKEKNDVKVFNPADTVRTREIKAYYNVRFFKANMQAKADSLYFNATDSALRCFKNPILWGENSQQTGDTIYVFFKNKKPHSFLIQNKGFIVNVETDSAKFNQVKGKKITGLFVDGELNNVFVDGNAESIYYTKKDNGDYDTMHQSISSRIKFQFDKKQLSGISMYNEVEGSVNPINNQTKATELTGFIWKPELRPTGKNDVIKAKPKTPAKPPAKRPAAQPGANQKPVENQAIKKKSLFDINRYKDIDSLIPPALKKELDSLIKKQTD